VPRSPAFPPIFFFFMKKKGVLGSIFTAYKAPAMGKSRFRPGGPFTAILAGKGSRTSGLAAASKVGKTPMAGDRAACARILQGPHRARAFTESGPSPRFLVQQAGQGPAVF